MTVFLDTSALLAVLDADDLNHSSADVVWRQLIESHEPLATSSFILVEVTALVQSRLGMPAARALSEDLLPWVEIEWVGPEIHGAAVAYWLAANRRKLSLVDCVSFEVMRRRKIDRAFAFDGHFAEQGFATVPRSLP